MTHFKSFTLALAGTAALGGCATVAPAPAAPWLMQLTANMTGAAEVPGPGDPDGTGTATITLDPSRSSLCYTLRVANIATPTAAHVHVGAAGAAGDHVVVLDAPATGSSSGCATIDPALMQAITANPGGYYVNVHNAEYPAGAIRGQLRR